MRKRKVAVPHALRAVVAGALTCCQASFTRICTAFAKILAAEQKKKPKRALYIELPKLYATIQTRQSPTHFV